jgi:hypothetical protein
LTKYVNIGIMKSSGRETSLSDEEKPCAGRVKKGIASAGSGKSASARKGGRSLFLLTSLKACPVSAESYNGWLHGRAICADFFTVGLFA